MSEQNTGGTRPLTDQLWDIEKALAAILRALERPEPGPYQDLAAAVKALQNDQDVARRMLTTLENITGHRGTPEFIVRHWRDQIGRWQYETTVSIRPDEVTSLPNSLNYVDDLARQEARRRDAQDQADRGQMQ